MEELVRITTGILQLFVNPHGQELRTLSTRSIAILAGALMAVIAFGLLRGPLSHAVDRLLVTAPIAAAGDEAAGPQVVARSGVGSSASAMHSWPWVRSSSP